MLCEISTGLAFFGRMCKDDGSSSSVVEDRGAFQSVRTIAHELGHRYINLNNK